MTYDILEPIYKLDRRILRLLSYGRGEKARKLFKPWVFEKRFNVKDFTFEDYKKFALEFTKSEIQELLLITEEEILNIQKKKKERKEYFKSQPSNLYIHPLRVSHESHKTWGVMDIETYGLDGGPVQQPYAWGFKIGKIERIFIDFDNAYHSLAKTLYVIADLTSKDVVIYLHNLSKFDSYFLIRAAIAEGLEINVIKQDSGFICVVVKIGDKSIHFKDSFLLLPMSLRALSKYFNVENPKQYFPHLFVSPDTANYVGDKPDIESYSDIPIEVYKSLPVSFNMAEEIHAYLKADVLSLYEVVYKFMSYMLTEHGLSTTKKLTLPQLAFSIWKKKYLNWKEVCILPRQIEMDIREGYYGGASEVYRPINDKAWYYDVNSMYPWAMTQPMPIGRPRTVLFTSEKYEDVMNDFFGFMKVEISIRKDSTYAPVLPRRIDGRMILGTGKWVGCYFNEELISAHNTGLYKIRPIMGYTFKKKHNLLTDYVNEFYKMKVEAPNPAIRCIAKLLLNSLYGRFGMKEISQETIIGNDSLPFDDLVDIEELGDDNNFFIYTIHSDKKKRTESNVAIAAAITAYARMKSLSIIREYENDIMYHDTDSFVLKKPINSIYLGEELGKMKNVAADENYSIKRDEEYYIKKPIFVAPKVYKYTTQNGEDVFKIKGINKKNQSSQLVEEMYFKLNTTTTTIQFKRILKTLEIAILKTTKKLRVVETKRTKKHIQGKWVDTAPVHFNENVTE